MNCRQTPPPSLLPLALHCQNDSLTAVTAPSGNVIALDYDSAGRRTKVRYPNGLNTESLFETNTATGTTGRLASITHGLNATGQGGSSLNLKLGTVSYAYDVKGNIIAANENGTTPRNRAYTLDAIERLTQVKDGSGATLESYTLDEEGNRITSHLASFHVTNVANRLTEDEKHQFEYDANGNMVRKTVKASGAKWRYSYTVWDELASASRHASADEASPVTEKVSYTFDALGRRISERRYDGGGALTGGTNFHYDGDHVAHEVAVDATGAVIAGSAKWTTHSDGVDDLLSVTLQAGTGPSSPTAVTSGAAMPSANGYYYHTDHQGSVRAITDQSGTITNAYAYDSYGTAEESVESLAQRFRYTGREFDALTGLYHYRARAYDPETARFLQEDPLWFDAGDLNIYRMTWNNPVNWTDPSGMAGEGVSYARIGMISVPIILALMYDYQNGGGTYQAITAISGAASQAGGFIGGWLLAGISAAVEWSNLHMRGLAGDLVGFDYNGDPYGIVPMYNTPAGTGGAGSGAGATSGVGAGAGGALTPGSPPAPWCSPEKLRELERHKSRECKNYSCGGIFDKAEIQSRIFRGQSCLAARLRVQQCYNSVDSGHMTQIDQVKSAISNCQGFLK